MRPEGLRYPATRTGMVSNAWAEAVLMSNGGERGIRTLEGSFTPLLA